MYAIIDEGGNQYRVTTGDALLIDRKVDEQTKTLTLDRVLLVAGEGSPRIGTPLVEGASVSVDVVGPEKGPKVRTVKHKRRKGYRKTIGHRQKYTRVRVTAINA